MEKFIKFHPHSNSERGMGKREERWGGGRKKANLQSSGFLISVIDQAEGKKAFASLTALGISVRLDQFLYRHHRVPISIWQALRTTSMLLCYGFVLALTVKACSFKCLCATFLLQSPENQQYAATSEDCHIRAWPDMFMNETVVLALVSWSLTECHLHKLWCSNSRGC